MGSDNTDAIKRIRKEIKAKGSDEFFIFLSHRKPDTDLAQSFKRQLQDLAPGKLHVWCAEKDIKSGSKWEPAIREALHAADMFLLIYTAEDWRWDWCNWEAGLFDKCEAIDEPIVVLRSPGLALPDPLQVYQGIEATHEALEEFLSDLMLTKKYTKHRKGVGILSEVSRERIAEDVETIVDLMGSQLRSGYIPLQMTVRWDPSEDVKLQGIPDDAIVEADEAIRVLFKVKVADETAVTWDQLTKFHRNREHVHLDSFSERWLIQLDQAVAELDMKESPEPLTWRFRGHQRMGLIRPYLYKYERRDERLTAISLLLLEEDTPRRVGGHRYNMLRSFERTWTEIVELIRHDGQPLGDAAESDGAWAQRRDQIRESIMMVRNEEATIEPFEPTRCQVVFGEHYQSEEIGPVLAQRSEAIDAIVAELANERDQFNLDAFLAAAQQLETALVFLWSKTSRLYTESVDRLVDPPEA